MSLSFGLSTLPLLLMGPGLLLMLLPERLLRGIAGARDPFAVAMLPLALGLSLLGLLLAGSGAWLLRSAWRPCPIDTPGNGGSGKMRYPRDRHH